MTRILVAGMGNLLRHDDGFGVAVAQQLARQNHLPAGTKIIEVGIGGIHLVQELMEGYDLLVIVDAVGRESEPGTVHVLEAEVVDLNKWPDTARRDFLADTHYATPSKALILAKALGILPPKVFIVGCQPAESSDLGIGLSEQVEQAISTTIGEIEKLVRHNHPERAVRDVGRDDP